MALCLLIILVKRFYWLGLHRPIGNKVFDEADPKMPLSHRKTRKRGIPSRQISFLASQILLLVLRDGVVNLFASDLSGVFPRRIVVYITGSSL